LRRSEEEDEAQQKGKKKQTSKGNEGTHTAGEGEPNGKGSS
jgi:hypothetical protein